MPKVVDCFPFFNEVELLEFRLVLLWDVVDYFVIAEATHTHAGHPKPMHFDPVRYAKYMSKIVHVVVDDFPETTDSWVRERFQRDVLTRGLARLSLQPDDILILSDLDELPNPTVVSNLPHLLEPMSLEMVLYYYNFETRFRGVWTQSKVCTVGQFRALDCTLSGLRARICPVIRNGGWHCSYFGSPERIQTKLQELNRDAYTNLDKIRERMKNHDGLYGSNFDPVRYCPGIPDVPPRSDWLLSLFKPPIQ